MPKGEREGVEGGAEVAKVALHLTVHFYKDIFKAIWGVISQVVRYRSPIY